MSSPLYSQNVEALRANADVLNPLILAMDAALAQPSYAYMGQIGGEWQQVVGPDSPTLASRSHTTCKEFLDDVCQLQTQHALSQESVFTGIPQKNESANFATVLRPVEGSKEVAFIRRCGLVGLYGFTHHTTARQYRIEMPSPESTRTLVLDFLGDTAVHAQEHQRPADLFDFARQCMNEFADKNAVDALLRGNFADQQQLDQLVSRLSATSEQAVLVDQIRTQALNIKTGVQFAYDLNLQMPDRQSLQDWHDVARLFT